MGEIIAHLQADRNDPTKGNTDKAGRRRENCWSDGVKCRSGGVGLIREHRPSILSTKTTHGAHCREWIYAVAGTYGSSFFIFNFDLDVTSISNMDWF